MTGRVSIGASPRELRRVKAVRVKELKMDLEPVGPNHEARRDCPIQQRGIKEISGVPQEFLMVTSGKSRVVTRYQSSLNREAIFLFQKQRLKASPQQGLLRGLEQNLKSFFKTEVEKVISSQFAVISIEKYILYMARFQIICGPTFTEN